MIDDDASECSNQEHDDDRKSLPLESNHSLAMSGRTNLRRTPTIRPKWSKGFNQDRLSSKGSISSGVGQELRDSWEERVIGMHMPSQWRN